MDYLEMDLGPENAVNPNLCVSYDRKVFGGELPDSELSSGKIRVRLGERPIARNLKDLIRSSGGDLPATMAVFKEYNIWVLTFGVGIIKHGGWRSVSQLGLQVELPLIPRFQVLGLLPETKFIHRFEGGLKCEAKIEANGAFKSPEFKGDTVGLPGSAASASAGANVGANIGWDISVSVLSPVVTAVGKGDRRAEWVIEADDTPLIGDQELTVTVLAPLTADEIEVKTHLLATTTTFDFLPVLLKSQEITMQIPLG